MEFVNCEVDGKVLLDEVLKYCRKQIKSLKLCNLKDKNEQNAIFYSLFFDPEHSKELTQLEDFYNNFLNKILIFVIVLR